MESELCEVAPLEWQRLPIEAVCRQVTSGGTPSRKRLDFYTNGRWHWVKTQELKDGWIDETEESITDEALASSSAKLLPPNTVLLALYGATVGKLGILRHKMACNQACCAMVVDPIRADYRFLFYQLRLSRPQLTSLASGAAQQNLNSQLLKSYKLPFPPLPEQRAIAHILGTLDDKIELNRRMSETLEAMARAIFKSWFIDFDPVRRNAARARNQPSPPSPLPVGEGWPTGRGEGVIEGGAFDHLFPDSFVDSELGEIPKGWEVKKLSDLCSTQYGYTASAVDEPVGPKFLRVTDINKRNWIEWGDVPHCVVDPDEMAAFTLRLGDLVVARMADPGKSAIVEEEIDAVFASYLVRLKTASLAHSYYVYGFLKSDLYAEYAEGAKSGSVQANMNAKVIVGASLAVPPTAVMEQYLKLVLPLRQRLVRNVRESRTLAQLRDALLPKLISGELRVKDPEKFLERVSA